MCVREVKSSLCLLNANNEGTGFPEGGEHNSSHRMGSPHQSLTVLTAWYILGEAAWLG